MINEKCEYCGLIDHSPECQRPKEKIETTIIDITPSWSNCIEIGVRLIDEESEQNRTNGLAILRECGEAADTQNRRMMAIGNWAKKTGRMDELREVIRESDESAG